MNFNLKEKFFTKIAVAVSVGILSAAGCPAGAAGMQTAGFDAAVQEPVRFEGVVIDENRIPLAGASVAVADDLSVGTITDVDGKFSISVLPGTKTHRWRQGTRDLWRSSLFLTPRCSRKW